MVELLAELQDLTYTYPGGELPALRDIRLKVPRGELLGVIGPSGAGKSSLAYALSGFIPHFYRGELSGTQRLVGMDAADASLADLAGRIGIVVQNPFNQISGARYTVRGETAFGLENLGQERSRIIERVDRMLELLDLSELADRSPFALSGGQQQRLALASILALDPELLVLDEPTSQLDPAGTREVFQALHNLATGTGTTAVLITHKLEWLAEFASRIVVLVQGRITLEGDPQQVLTDPHLEQWGLGGTQYTRAARLSQEAGLIKPERLPITLDQAVEVFD